MNMSYCRFQNTLMDLRDCQENMDDRDLSPEEKRARKELIDVCWRIAKDYGEEGDQEGDEEDDEGDEDDEWTSNPDYAPDHVNTF